MFLHSTEKGQLAPSEMRTYCGKRPSYVTSDYPPVMGRLVFAEKIQKGYYGDALITVVEGDNIPEISSNTVGVICVSHGNRSAEAEARSFPCPAITLDTLPKSCEGRIAMLDPYAEKLFVSPDIEAVNEYVKRTTKKPISQKTGIRLLPIYGRGADIPKDAKGFLLESTAVSGIYEEEALYEAYRDIAELSTGAKITAVLELDEKFSQRLRALYRSAIYGNISLLLRGALTERDVKKALSEAHSVFCELEAEGREFNGYISRGICVDSPYLLSKPISGDGIDFQILDAERLLRLMTGNTEPPCDEIMIDVAKEMIRAREELPQIKSQVILGSNTARSVFLNQLTKGGIYTAYAPHNKLDLILKEF